MERFCEVPSILITLTSYLYFYCFLIPQFGSKNNASIIVMNEICASQKFFLNICSPLRLAVFNFMKRIP